MKRPIFLNGKVKTLMQIRIEFPGTTRAVIRGKILPSVKLDDVRKLWEAEKAITELTTIKMQIHLEEDKLADEWMGEKK